MRTRTEMKGVVVLLSAFLLTGTAGALCLVDGADACWEVFKTEAGHCCDMPSPAAVKACIDGELAVYKQCIAGETDKPSDCHEQFRKCIRECATTPPCGTPGGPGEEACYAAAQAFLLWCTGNTAATGNETTSPQWIAFESTVEIGESATFTTRTDDSSIALVRYIAFRPEASSSDPDATFVLGNGSATSLGGKQKSWSLTCDSQNWPVGTGEERLVVWAESYYQCGPDRLIWGASEPIDIVLTH